ncbi:hypothetical protein CLV42_106380 [Chitinophaga ginsengisoli]|uniref:Uncharacterized protein n=1 Tax=Chitinophaga ginsengisoli TaxID=363837 RepID=A0A2P8G7T0_9BACT|nr:hypothetical protein CLV42_106380 [Chitinophaga ginsengisoli]
MIEVLPGKKCKLKYLKSISFKVAVCGPCRDLIEALKTFCLYFEL